jgi:hypothetical protein
VLGHATVSITLDTYSHATPPMQKEAAALIAGLMFAGTTEPIPGQVPASPCRRCRERSCYFVNGALGLLG